MTCRVTKEDMLCFKTADAGAWRGIWDVGRTTDGIARWWHFSSGPIDLVTVHMFSARLWGCHGTRVRDQDRGNPHPQRAPRREKMPGEER